MALNRKTGIIIIIVITITTVIALNRTKPVEPQPKTDSPPQNTQEDKPQITSTKPQPLEQAIVSATEVIEITFNKPLENAAEFKIRIDPKLDMKIELSQDRKTAKITPKTPYDLGVTYTLFINPDTKFEGVGEWREDKMFHFRTVRYRGV